MFSLCDLESLYIMFVSATKVLLGGIYAPHIWEKKPFTSAFAGGELGIRWEQWLVQGYVQQTDRFCLEGENKLRFITYIRQFVT